MLQFSDTNLARDIGLLLINWNAKEVGDCRFYSETKWGEYHDLRLSLGPKSTDLH